MVDSQNSTFLIQKYVDDIFNAPGKTVTIISTFNLRTTHITLQYFVLLDSYNYNHYIFYICLSVGNERIFINIIEKMERLRACEPEVNLSLIWNGNLTIDLKRCKNLKL